MRNFTEEQVMFREAYRKFIDQEIAPNMPTWKKAGIVDRSAFKKAGEQGFLMIWPDEKYGGMGLDYTFNVAAVEAGASRRDQKGPCKGCPASVHREERHSNSRRSDGRRVDGRRVE